jgi:hypothetical protein
MNQFPVEQIIGVDWTDDRDNMGYFRFQGEEHETTGPLESLSNRRMLLEFLGQLIQYHHIPFPGLATRKIEGIGALRLDNRDGRLMVGAMLDEQSTDLVFYPYYEIEDSAMQDLWPAVLENLDMLGQMYGIERIDLTQEEEKKEEKEEKAVASCSYEVKRAMIPVIDLGSDTETEEDQVIWVPSDWVQGGKQEKADEAPVVNAGKEEKADEAPMKTGKEEKEKDEVPVGNGKAEKEEFIITLPDSVSMDVDSQSGEGLPPIPPLLMNLEDMTFGDWMKSVAKVDAVPMQAEPDPDPVDEEEQPGMQLKPRILRSQTKLRRSTRAKPNKTIAKKR